MTVAHLWSHALTPGKWIADLKPDMPLAEAARRVLSVRLEVVREFLDLALRESDKDPEYVHQLRVGTRRAGAALDIFCACLPDKTYEKTRKLLKRIRRGAGAARDWDVFLLDLLERNAQASSRHRAAFDFLLGYSIGQRTIAQDDLLKIHSDHPQAVENGLQETLSALHKPKQGPQRLIDLAHAMLAQLLKGLESAVAQDLNDYHNLHQVRIAGKRLRYAMEVFADCYPASFKEKHYAAVEEMQDILGRANDSHVTCQRLGSLRDKLKSVYSAEWKRCKAGLEGLLKLHEKRLPEERRNFERWWHDWRPEEGEAKLVSLIERKNKPDA